MAPLSRTPGREHWNASCAATISERQNERHNSDRKRPFSRPLRRVRSLRPFRSREARVSGPLRAAAPRPGIGGDCFARRAPNASGKKDGGGGGGVSAPHAVAAFPRAGGAPPPARVA